MKVALADDEALFRRGVALMLEDFGAELQFEADNGTALLAQLRAADVLPDILLLDLNMPNLNGVDTAKVIQQEFPDLKYIVLSSHFSKMYILKMLELGAVAYLPKNATPEEMEHCIKEVVEKGFYYGPEVMEVIRKNMVSKSRPQLKTPFNVSLSTREKEVLQLICKELTTAEIGERLFISPRTVEGHRINLLQKLDCKNTAGLVVIAIQRELVNIDPLGF